MSVADLQEVNAALAAPVKSTTLSRWERKALHNQEFKAQLAKTPNKAVRTVTSSSKTPAKNKVYGDRFIPNRDAMNQDMVMYSASTNNGNGNEAGDTAAVGSPHAHTNAQGGASALSQASTENAVASRMDLNQQLAESLFKGENPGTKILAFKNKAPKASEGYTNRLKVLYSQNRAPSQVQRNLRHISQTAEKVLDAPGILDDFYLNVVDWSSNDTLAVALGRTVYLWNAATGDIEELLETPEDLHVTSVQWTPDGSHLAVGTSGGSIQMWNAERKAQVRNMPGHAARIGSLSWNRHVLASGSADHAIFTHDVRVRNHHLLTLQGHEQEVCGLKWSPDGEQLASGSNDNRCCIWDVNQTAARFTFSESVAAVKALAWCPFQRHTLATGGGTADRHIRFYNTQSGSLLHSIDTLNQVSSLVWSKTEKELLSGHGFSQNSLMVWKFPSMVKVAELHGHTARVLQTAASCDGTTVVSAGADETLRFWKIWDSAPTKRPAHATAAAAKAGVASSQTMMSCNSIR